MIHGAAYEIVDIGMRMLSPRELFAAQGFPDDYDILPTLHGKPITKTQQIALAGNSCHRRWLNTGAGKPYERLMLCRYVVGAKLCP